MSSNLDRDTVAGFGFEWERFDQSGLAASERDDLLDNTSSSSRGRHCPESMDFGYSLGVLHHVPDTAAGIRSCVLRLKKGAPFLLYLYYAFDNRPLWFRLLWRGSDILRRGISRCPHGLRYAISQAIATFVYLPLARVARLAERAGMGVSGFPLSYYRGLSFYTMRTDALDRFGTKVEQRFTARQIREMMTEAGLEKIAMRDGVPFWCAVGWKK